MLCPVLMRAGVMFLPMLCCTVLSGNKLCIVMEYAPAGDLSSFLKAAAASKLPLPEATVWQIFLQLCQGMQVGGRAAELGHARLNKQPAYSIHRGL